MCVDVCAVTVGGVAELLEDTKRIAVRMYSTQEMLHNRELCGVLNEALRLDVVVHAVVLTRALNLFLVTGRAAASAPVRWPASNMVWRGGGMPRRHRHFFVAGRTYRVPMFVSTSSSRGTADYFMQRQTEEPILWTIRFGPHRCNHVNFISVHDGSLGGDPNVAAEDEFMFVPYSGFTVASVLWREAPTVAQPHEVVIDAAADNRNMPDDVPLAPWA